MNEKDLKDIIAQVLSEINLENTAAAPAADTAAAPATDAPAEKAPEIEEGCWEDVAAIDLKKQYLVENPVNGEAFYDLKQYAPCRLGIGKAGARYKTLPVLEFRAAHAAAQDAVFSDVDQDFVDKMGLFTVQTKCDSKDTYLTRPDLGRMLSDEGAKVVAEKCEKNPCTKSGCRRGRSLFYLLWNRVG